MCIRSLFAAAVVSVSLVSAAWAGVTVITTDTVIADGDLAFDGQDIVVRGCTVTINGAHTFSSLMVERSPGNVAGVVTHTAAFSNGIVNGMFLTITGDCTVQGVDGALVGSRIDVSGRGHPGSTGPGAGTSAPQAAGGGYGGNGGAGNAGPTATGGVAYGSVVMPSDLGSGGGQDTNSGAPGGSGGGAVRLVVGGALTIDGSITSRGANFGGSEPGAGSGGSIWVDAGVLAGIGTIQARGGSGNNTWSGGGGGGRIAAYYDSSTFTGTMDAFGGTGWRRGGAGTVFTKLTADALGDLAIVDAAAPESDTPIPSAFTSADAATFAQATVVIDHDITFNDLTIQSGGFVTHTPASSSGLHLTVNDDLAVQVGGTINVNSRGHPSSTGVGEGTDAVQASAGGYGGNGGAGNTAGATGGVAYGSVTNPADLGSGGGFDTNAGIPGGAGGGAIHLVVGDALVVDGTIEARGQNTPGFEAGPGSGGSIWLDVGALTGTGAIQARGGSGNNTWSGGGGGGRIAVLYDTNSFAGALEAFGGTGWVRGGAGTVFTKAAGDGRGDLIITGGAAAETPTPLLSTFPAFDNVVYSQAIVTMDHPVDFNDWTVGAGATATHTAQLAAGLFALVNGDLTIETGGTVNVNGRGHPGSTGLGEGGDAVQASGGGYGGNGGAGNVGAGLPGGLGYGSILQPVDLGSGGGNDTNSGHVGGAGGGAVRLIVGNALIVNGVIQSRGLNTTGNESGAGAGGSIWIDAESIGGSGSIDAGGGNGNNTWSGGGGGGRIALYMNNSSFGGLVSAFGGNGWSRGGAGTIVSKLDAEPLANLITNSGWPALVAETRIAGVPQFESALIIGASNTVFTQPVTITGDLTVSSQSRATFDGTNSIGGDVNVHTGGNITHSPTVAGMHLMIDGDATVAADGLITVNGRGHPASTGPGQGNDAIQASSAGYGGNGGIGNTNNLAGGTIYGSVKEPVDLGSGGGNDTNQGNPGGAGGGAIRLTVDGTLTVDGLVEARGANLAGQEAGAGSGGSVWLDAGTLAGSGAIQARGGNGNGGFSGGGGGGRIAAYYGASSFTGTMDALGGTGWVRGGVGTISLKPDAEADGNLIVSGIQPVQSDTPLPASFTTANSATFSNATVVIDHALALTDWTVQAGGIATHSPTLASGLLVTVNDDLVIDAGGTINVNGRGHAGSTGPGQGTDAPQAAGGGYGGPGGNGNAPGAFGGVAYGSATGPIDLGSGGGNDTNSVHLGGAGGGRIRLIVGDSITVNGVIEAKGQNTPGNEAGAGSGGSIWIDTEQLDGTGAINANGGNANVGWSGGGGGGRIAIYSEGGSLPIEAVTAAGGSGWDQGECGTVFFRDACPANFNGDCVIGSSDITYFLSLWFTDLANGTTITDVDGNGSVGSSDITFFLNRWFAALAAGGC